MLQANPEHNYSLLVVGRNAKGEERAGPGNGSGSRGGGGGARVW